MLLVYLGARIPSRILSWPVVGIGTVFIVVMTSYAFVTLGQRVSDRLQPLVRRMRGDVVTDPQLGALTRDVNAHCWIATLARDDRTIDVVIDGDDRPNPTLLASARDLVARFDTLERDVTAYLAAEAENETSDDPESAAEIRELRISSITLRSPASPARVVVDLEGRDDMRYWYCDYVNGDLSGLRFDT